MSTNNMMTTTNNLAYSIQLILSPTTPPQTRQDAQNMIENFRVNSTPQDRINIGIHLAHTSTDHSVILTGLQFIERVIKFDYSEINEALRTEVKTRLLNIVQAGFKQFLQNSNSKDPPPSYLEEALAKVITEIVMKEWPQLWPTMFQDLTSLTTSSNVPLLILRTLSEDVVNLQLVDFIDRRRELSQSLNLICPDIINLIYKCLEESFGQRNINSKRRTKACLSTLLPFIEWVPITNFTGERINILYEFMKNPDFKMAAADCLIQLMDRKIQKPHEKTPFFNLLLTQQNLNNLIQSINLTGPNELDFIRKTSDLLALICSNWPSTEYELILNLLNVMGNRQEATSILTTVFGCNLLLKGAQNNETALKLIPGIMSLLNYPINKLNSSLTQKTESEELIRLKSEFSQLLKLTGKVEPNLYTVVSGWLHSALISNVVIMNQWETLVIVLDAVASSVPSTSTSIITQGLTDLQLTVNRFKSEPNAQTKSIILSSVSALFVFLQLAKEASGTRGELNEAQQKLMIQVLDGIFECFVTGDDRILRRHASALLIKLSAKNPTVLVQAFDYIQSAGNTVAPKLTTMEHHSIIESLLLISNEWTNPPNQANLISTLINNNEWSQIQTFSSLTIFQQMLTELNLPQFRTLVIKNLSIFHSILKRIKYNNSQPHPCFTLIQPLIPVVLELVKTIHSLNEITNLKYVFDLNENEKGLILGVHPNNFGPLGTCGASSTAPNLLGIPETNVLDTGAGVRTHSESVKVFIQNSQDLAFTILGEICTKFTTKLYTIPQVGQAYLNYVAWDCNNLPDYRIRCFIRNVFRPFLLCCPIQLSQSVVLPFMCTFGGFMHNRLSTRWTSITAITEQTTDGDDSDSETEEILQNASLRLLTKDYFELLVKLLEKRSTTGSFSLEEDQNMDMDQVNNRRVSSNVEIGDVGQILLQDPACFESIIHLAITSLAWPDSQTMQKSGRILMLAWPILNNHQNLVHATLIYSLKAISTKFDNDDSSFDILQKIIDIIFKNWHDKDPVILQTMSEWGATPDQIKTFAELSNSPKNDKKRVHHLRQIILSNPNIEMNQAQKSKWLKGLPKINLPSGKVSENNSIDLKECFSLIHS